MGLLPEFPKFSDAKVEGPHPSSSDDHSCSRRREPQSGTHSAIPDIPRERWMGHTGLNEGVIRSAVYNH